MTLTRRDFVWTAGAGVVATASLQARAATPKASSGRRPNIIYILADQLRYQSCGYAGDKKAHTPNLDQFAKSGINFRQAVSSMPDEIRTHDTYEKIKVKIEIICDHDLF